MLSRFNLRTTLPSRYYHSRLRDEAVEFRKVKGLSQGHGACKWLSLELNPGPGLSVHIVTAVYCRKKRGWNFPKAWKGARKWEVFEQRLGGHLSGTVERGELDWIITMGP